MDTIPLVITLPLAPHLIDQLAAVSSRLDISVREASSAAAIGDVLSNAEILYTWQVVPDPAEAPRLRWVQLHGAGADRLFEHALYTNTDIAFTTTSGIHAVPMAEYAIAQMLAFAHRLPLMLADQASATWPTGRWVRYLPSELYGATLGIVGYGSIGRRLARVAQSLGMRILAVKRDLRNLQARNPFTLPDTGDPSAEIPDRIYPPGALHSFLRECDYVVLTVPLTPRTRHLIDAPALQAMKSSAILINIARGDVVDEKALIDALEKRVIAGAALDVFCEEPLPASSPLWKLPNAILSPHVAGITPHYDERAVALFAENLRRYIAGDPLINQVDRDRGY